MTAAEEDLSMKAAIAYVQRRLAEQGPPICLLIAAQSKDADPKPKCNHDETRGRREAIYRFERLVDGLSERINLAEAALQQLLPQSLQPCTNVMPLMSLWVVREENCRSQFTLGGMKW
jgi:hypothetical protein